MKKQSKNKTALSCEDIISILKKELPRLKNEYGAERITLYGSFAKGNPKKTSGLDILVDIRRLIGLEFVALADELEDENAQWGNFTVAEFMKGYSEKDAMYDSL